MNINNSALGFIMVAGIALSPVAQGANIVDENNTKAVGHVVWRTQVDVNPQDLINRAVPDDTTSIFFIRRNDDDVAQLSANIAINNRFQVSLHPGNYTQVYSCVGTNRISVAPTGLKTNDLLLQSYPVELEGGQNHFFYIDINAQGNSEIQRIPQHTALEVLNDKRYQAHQITRVVPNCPAPQPKPVAIEPAPAVEPAPVVEPSPIVVVEPPPVLKEKVSIELEVLFDNDKATIKPQYANEVAAVADFMKEYTNATAIIEGHTDSNGSASYNESLSQRRADAIKQMLTMQYGIDPKRVSSVGYGESQPRATNATADGRQQNRRVIAVLEEIVEKQ